MNITFKTAESVCEGHPDKLCDKIADAILDAYLYKDKGAPCCRGGHGRGTPHHRRR